MYDIWPPFSVSVRLIENRLTEIFSVNRLTENIPSSIVIITSVLTFESTSIFYGHLSINCFALLQMFFRIKMQR